MATAQQDFADTPEGFDEAFAKQEPERDERGRFAARDDEPEPGNDDVEQQQPEEQPEPERQEEPEQQEQEPDPQQEPEHRIPLAEFLDQRERRQAAERERDDYRQRMAQLQREMEGLKNPPKQPDLIAEPDAWGQNIVQTLERKMQTRFLNASLADAHEANGEAFEHAFAMLEGQIQAGDTADRDRIVSAHNPGRALMRWYGQQMALQEVGSDVDGYRQRVAEDAIQGVTSDPEWRRAFLGQLIMEARENSRSRRAGPADRDENVTRLPSLNRATGSGGRQTPGSLGDTDAERFANAFASPRR